MKVVNERALKKKGIYSDEYSIKYKGNVFKERCTHHAEESPDRGFKRPGDPARLTCLPVGRSGSAELNINAF